MRFLALVFLSFVGVSSTVSKSPKPVLVSQPRQGPSRFAHRRSVSHPSGVGASVYTPRDPEATNTGPRF